jgi:hypothetical protein
VFILLAAANAAGVVADETARVLFIVLPIVAWMAISGGGCCLLRAKGSAR